MRAEHVQAAVCMPGSKPHPVFQRQVMPCDAENLHHAAALAILIGHGGHHLAVMQSLFSNNSINGRPAVWIGSPSSEHFFLSPIT